MAKMTLENYAKTRSAAILDAAQESGDFAAASAAGEKLFDQVVAWGTSQNLDAFREAAYTRRLTGQLAKGGADTALLKYLRANDNVARTLAFLMDASEDPKGVYAILGKLREKDGEKLDKYATLAAAVCVVHDRPFMRGINENTCKSPDAVEIFDFYVKNEGAMLFGIKAVPAELLIYVVDTTASIEDMNWALKKYAKDEMVGRHFFDIKYDYEHLRKMTPKKVTKAGYTLPNILQYGGVCADQAYYAMSVGKSIGVPTAYATGSSGAVGHAWVGFLQAQAGRGVWNFNVGRYEEYRGVKGNVMDPQLKRSVPDSYVSLLAELIGTKANDRQNTVALTDAAVRLRAGVAAEALDVEITNGRRVVRDAGVDGQLELLELGLRQNPGYPRGWFAVRDLAKDGKLTLAHKIRWSEVLMKLCGGKYPDFALAVLVPMIETVEDVKEQNKLWNGAFTMFQSRADLAAEIRMRNARMHEAAGNTNAAGLCYMNVIEKFANAGPFVLEALRGAEKLLAGDEAKILVLYDSTWSKVRKPQEMAGPFMQQSNWYRVGKIYASKLKTAGKTDLAAKVEAALGDDAAS